MPVTVYDIPIHKLCKIERLLARLDFLLTSESLISQVTNKQIFHIHLSISFNKCCFVPKFIMGV